MIEGDNYGLLDSLHATGCDGQEYTTVRPVPVFGRQDPEEPDFHVLYLEWCGECGAADWEYVGR